MSQHKYWVRPRAVAIPEDMCDWEAVELAVITGQVYVVYLFDEASVTYVCSPEAMFWLEPIAVFAENSISPEDQERLHDAVFGIDQYAGYRSVKMVESFKPWYKYPAICPEHFTDEDREKAWQEALEKAQANHGWHKDWWKLLKDPWLNPAP